MRGFRTADPALAEKMAVINLAGVVQTRSSISSIYSDPLHSRMRVTIALRIASSLLRSYCVGKSPVGHGVSGLRLVLRGCEFLGEFGR